MKVVMIAPQYPWPPRQGTAIRNYHLARELARRHDLTLVAFGSAPEADDPLVDAGVEVVAVPPPRPRDVRRRIVDMAIQPAPDLARRLLCGAMTQAVARAIAGGPGSSDNADVLQVEGLEMAPYALATRAPSAPHAPRLVYDAHNAEWLLQHRAWRTDARRPGAWHGALYSFVQTRKLRRFERRLLAEAGAVVAVSRPDASALRSIWPSATIAVVPNGVDTAHYEPADASLAEPGLCVFTGKMDFRPNVDAMTWFCRHVWPRIVAQRPDARLEIVGRDPVPRVRALASPSVIVTGPVEDVRSYLRRAAVVVAPLRVGGGTRLKVLEAMAMARPVAATSLGIEGLDVLPGRDLLAADAPRDLAAAVVALLQDPSLRDRIGRYARAMVDAAYRWDTLVPRIERLYSDPSKATGREDG